MGLLVLTLIVVMIVTTISALITGLRMRRKIKKALGSRASDTELTSISMWMKVNDAERQAKENDPNTPR